MTPHFQVTLGDASTATDQPATINPIPFTSCGDKFARLYAYVCARLHFSRVSQFVNYLAGMYEPPKEHAPVDSRSRWSLPYQPIFQAHSKTRIGFLNSLLWCGVELIAVRVVYFGEHEQNQRNQQEYTVQKNARPKSQSANHPCRILKSKKRIHSPILTGS